MYIVLPVLFLTYRESREETIPYLYPVSEAAWEAMYSIYWFHDKDLLGVRIARE